MNDTTQKKLFSGIWFFICLYSLVESGALHTSIYYCMYAIYVYVASCQASKFFFKKKLEKLPFEAVGNKFLLRYSDLLRKRLNHLNMIKET
jgi:hypothetical protein